MNPLQLKAGIVHIAPPIGLELTGGTALWSLQNDSGHQLFAFLSYPTVKETYKRAGDVFTPEEVAADPVYQGTHKIELSGFNNSPVGQSGNGFLSDMNGVIPRLAIGAAVGDSSSYRDKAVIWNLGLENLQSEDNPALGDPALRYSDGPFQHFESGMEGYFGFRFDLDADGDRHSQEWQYGWARVTFTGEASFSFGSDGPPPTGMTLHEWAYEETVGRSIQAGAIPEPSTLAMAGIIGFAVYLIRYRFAC